MFTRLTVLIFRISIANSWLVYLPQILTFMISELDERMRDLKNELQSFDGEEYDESHKRKAIEALKRMENWNLFSDNYEVGPWVLFFRDKY